MTAHVANAFEEPAHLREPSGPWEERQKASKTSAWAVETDEAFLAREFPPDEWLIDGLLPANQLSVLFAGPSVGKTFTALDWGYRVAASGRNVLVIEAEGSGAKFQTRLRRARAAHDPIEGSVRIVFRPVGFSFTDPDHAAWLVKQAKDLECDLIVIDSMSALTDASENEEMRAIAEALRDIQTTIGNCALLVLHHMVKEAWKPGQRPTLASLRGPGPLAAALDTAIALTPDPKPVGGVVRFTLWVMKHRDEAQGAAFAVEILMTGPTAIVTMQPYEAPPPREARPAERAGAVKAKVLDLLAKKPDSASGLARSLHVQKETALKLVAEMEAEKTIVHIGSKWHVAGQGGGGAP
jgi:hypothetical protein